MKIYDHTIALTLPSAARPLLDLASERKSLRLSEYVRLALVERLVADGIAVPDDVLVRLGHPTR